MKKDHPTARWRSAIMAGVTMPALAFAITAHAQARYDPVKGIAKYDIIWNTPSRDARGSMPAGNGDISLNVWVEESGDLVFYVGKTDTWGDNSRLLKVGRVRVKFTPNPYPQSKAFWQALRLEDATIEIRYGEGDSALRARVWVDAGQPIIHVQAEGRRSVEAVASIELWRTAPFTLPSIEVSDVHFDHDVPGNQHFPTIVEPDTVLTGQMGRIGWYHHNKKSVGPALCAGLQDMEGYRQDDPILQRTFGAVITAVRGRRADDLHLVSPRGPAHRFDIYVLTRHPSSPEKWLRDMDELVAATEKVPFESRLAAHRAWWKEFWNRSWIDIEWASQTDDTYVLCRGYNLQRFINACAGRGRYAIKFNGSIFTVPNPGSPGDADYRRWGPGYWWQNTRLPYISMCASGDFDLMAPLFRMYGGDILDMAKYRTKHYLGHAGAYLNECVYFWGAAFNESYGWTPREKRKVKVNESRWHRWEFQGGIELVQMMLDYYEHTQDEAFLRERLIPFAREILTFYDLHYKVDASGKIMMEPAQALETWWDCRNPMPEIAGILSVTERLMALAGERAGGTDAALWRRLRDKMPGLPTRVADGKRLLAPAESFADKNNVENPELYAVFPYRQVAIGRPGTALAVEALDRRWDRGNFGWRQEDIFMAYLGLTEEAREYVVGRARKWDENFRFPAFWGPNYDWVPDQDHGGVLLKTLQAMLMQTDGRKIFLLPAWPKEWNVEFKLQAPYRTEVAGRVKGGKVVVLEVRPPERKEDVLMKQTP
jgi:alpha-L-fucosidase 2